MGDTQAAIDSNIAALKKISAACASIMAKLATDDVIDQKTFADNNKVLNARIDESTDKKLADLSISVHYLSLAELQVKYPIGAASIFMLPN